MKGPICAVQIDLDTCWWFDAYNENNGEFIDSYRDKLYDFLKENVLNANANTVYLQAFSEEGTDNEQKNDKWASDLFFEIEPVEDITRSHALAFQDAIDIIKELNPECNVLAWMPTLNVKQLTEHNRGNLVVNYRGVRVNHNQNEAAWYRRGSPFSEYTQSYLKKVYAALGRVSSQLDGVLLNDDLFINNWEDFSPAGKAAAQKYHAVDNKYQLKRWLDDDEASSPWQLYKAETLDDLANDIFDEFQRSYRHAFPEAYEKRLSSKQPLIQARNMYANTIEVLSNEKVKIFFGQDINLWTENCDQVVIMAYPSEDKDGDNSFITHWLSQLVNIAEQYNIDIDKLVFKIQSCYWNSGNLRSKNELRKRLGALHEAGATNLGYYPQFPCVNTEDSLFPR